MLGSPTHSVTRYLQQAGRAMRPGEGKTALILDLAGISHELGLPDEVREWSLEDGEVREPQKAHARPRDCPKCLTVFYGRVCPECAHAEPMLAVPEVETELEEATSAPPKRKGNRRADLWRDVAIAKKAADPRQAMLAVAARRGLQTWLGESHPAGMGVRGMSVPAEIRHKHWPIASNVVAASPHMAALHWQRLWQGCLAVDWHAVA